MAKQERRRVRLILTLGSILAIALTVSSLLLLRCTKPGAWRNLTNDEGLAAITIALGGSIIGSGIAILLAYGILRAQIVADRTLAADSHAMEVVHDLAGELAVWVAAFKKPKLGTGEPAAQSPGLDGAIRTLTSRRDFLDSVGLKSSDHLLQAIQQLDGDRSKLIAGCRSIQERGVAPSEIADYFQISWDLDFEVDVEWAKIQTELNAISAHIRDLAAWNKSGDQPGYSFRPGTRVSVIDIEKRLLAKGHQITRDPWQELAGAYGDPPALDEDGDRTSHEADPS